MPRARSHALTAALIALGAGSLMTGCAMFAQPVEVAPAPASTSAECAGIDALWPAEVAGAGRTETRPEAPSMAAWAQGRDPAIIARCGVAVPAPTTNECIAVDDVDWVAERLDDGMRLTTYGRDPAVEVLVPDRYAPEPLVLSSFGAAAKAGRPTGHVCR